MYKQIAHRIKFHIYSWRENLFARLIQREDGKRWMLGFFNGHSFFYQIELNLYSCYPLFPLCFKILFILFIYQCNVHSFLKIAICIYLCFAENVLFQFLVVGFISHAIRILVTTPFFFRRWAVKGMNLETIFSRFTNWNVLQWIFDGRGFW